MKKDKNICIRIERDGKQIEWCKKKLVEIKAPVSRLSRVLSLAGNEVRMKILFLLREEGKLCVCDLSEILEMKIPAVSQHLRKLKDAKLVFSQREGATIYYQVHPEMKSILQSLFSLIPETMSA